MWTAIQRDYADVVDPFPVNPSEVEEYLTVNADYGEAGAVGRGDRSSLRRNQGRKAKNTIAPTGIPKLKTSGAYELALKNEAPSNRMLIGRIPVWPVVQFN